jgi:single-stranded-DNA-specific exonuclease
MPPAAAIVNPKRPESAYPERALAGVGIAYKLAQALRLALPDRAEYEDEQFLDLVALGTVADLAPLLGENRRLVIEGLRVLNQCRRPGIEALANAAGLQPGKMTAESIAFALAPRLNAAGRLAHAYDAARLLAANNAPAAREYAVELNRLNRERQRLTADLSRAAEDMVVPGEPLAYAAHPSFQAGVVGLVASRLADRLYRPAIVVEQGETESRGSCRSIPEFDITGALDQVADLLVRHGGHHQAAGFTIQTALLPEFRARMMALAAEALDPAALQPTLSIDAELPVADVDWALQQVLDDKLEPTGTANVPPLFMSRNVQVYGHRLVGKDQNHLQIWVGDGQMKLGCIAFSQGAWAGTLPGRVDLAYTVGVNEWNGRRDLQLQIQDIREPETP